MKASLMSETHSYVSNTLKVENLRLGYGSKIISDDLSLSLRGGEVSILVGANGCGKSTLLKAIARINKPISGRITLDGDNIHEIPAKAVARRMAFLPQSPIAPSGISVLDLVGRGRYPHQGWFRRWSHDDDGIVEEALRLTSTLEYAGRSVESLSGGQRQRVWIAMILAQKTDILLLDEPTTYLDLNHQIQLLDLLAELNRTRNTTIIAVLHELNLAVRYADELIGIRAGQVAFSGPPARVVTSETLKEVFGLESKVFGDADEGFPIIIPKCR